MCLFAAPVSASSLVIPFPIAYHRLLAIISAFKIICNSNSNSNSSVIVEDRLHFSASSHLLACSQP